LDIANTGCQDRQSKSFHAIESAICASDPIFTASETAALAAHSLAY